MKVLLSILFLILTAAGYAVLKQPKGEVVLLGAIQLQAKPFRGAAVIAVLEEGEKIFFERQQNDWFKIDFSRELEVWTASCFLKNGVFTDQTVFRVKPTAGSAVVTVNGNMAGKKADIIESESSEDWKKIRLKADFSGYISLRDLERSLKKKENRHFVHNTPIISTAVGRLLPLEKPVKNATHKLIYRVYETEYLVAYIVPDKVNLRLWENWMIYLSGERTWHPSVFTPFMKGANIFPAYR